MKIFSLLLQRSSYSVIQANILPVIVTNHTVTIAAELVTPILIQLLLILKYKSSKGKRRENGRSMRDLASRKAVSSAHQHNSL